MIIEQQYLCSYNNILADFLKDNTKQILKIQSPMGTGKTNIIYDLLNKDLRLCFITNRVSLALEFKDRFKNFNIKYYKDQDYKTNDSLIVQYDSLNKYDLNNFDIVIIDEFVSLILHSLSFLTDKAGLNFFKLFFIMTKKKVIVLDAFFTKEIEFLYSTEIINSYRDNTPVVLYSNKNTFLHLLLQRIKENKTITISTSSLMIAKILLKKIKKITSKVFLLSSETKEQDKEQILKQLKQKESVFDVLIYTPTITTGVDILYSTDSHWHYDEGKSCDVISSLQMIKRTRTSKEINVYISSKRKRDTTDLEQLNKELNKEIEQGKINNPFLVSMDYSSGNYTLSPLGFFYNKIKAFYNSIENNHKKTFIDLLSYQFNNISYNKTIIDQSINIETLKQDIIKEQEQKNKKLYYNKRAEEIKQEIKELFNKDIPEEQIEKFLLDNSYYRYSKNRELFKLNIKELKVLKQNRINNFNFDNKDLDLLITFKQKNFILKEVFLKKDLKSKEIEFLKILGYKNLNNKLCYID